MKKCTIFGLQLFQIYNILSTACNPYVSSWIYSSPEYIDFQSLICAKKVNFRAVAHNQTSFNMTLFSSTLKVTHGVTYLSLYNLRFFTRNVHIQSVPIYTFTAVLYPLMVSQQVCKVSSKINSRHGILSKFYP